MPWHLFESHFAYVVDDAAARYFLCVRHAQRPVLTINFEHLLRGQLTMPNHAYSIGLEVVAVQLPIHCSLCVCSVRATEEENVGKKHQLNEFSLKIIIFCANNCVCSVYIFSVDFCHLLAHRNKFSDIYGHSLSKLAVRIVFAALLIWRRYGNNFCVAFFCFVQSRVE